MVKIKQDLLNSIKEFTLMDDPFMTKVFEDDIERTQLILRIILENDTIKVKKASGRLQVQVEQNLSSNYISGIHLIKKSVEQFIRSVVA